MYRKIVFLKRRKTSNVNPIMILAFDLDVIRVQSKNGETKQSIMISLGWGHRYWIWESWVTWSLVAVSERNLSRDIDPEMFTEIPLTLMLNTSCTCVAGQRCSNSDHPQWHDLIEHLGHSVETPEGQSEP